MKKIAGIQISAEDNVVTVTHSADAGDLICYTSGGAAHELTAVSEIPKYHKAACREIPAGQPIIKYGEPIGIAGVPIPPGTHVHTHNLQPVAFTDPRRRQ